jgi:prophage antirepressor-like protein
MSQEIVINTSLIFNTDKIRAVGTYDDPWFIAKDVCKGLLLNNTTMAIKKIPEKWRGSIKMNTLGGVQECIIINESGLYALVMRSNTAESKKFREWICEDVIPSIRKKGKYEFDEQVKQKLLEQEIQHKQKLIENEQTLQAQQKELTQLNSLLKRKLRKKYRKGECVYIITHTAFKNSIKIGKTEDMNRRTEDYKTGAPTDYTILYQRMVPNQTFKTTIESMALFIFEKYRYETDEKHSKKREWIKLNNDITIETIQKEMDDLCDYLLSRRKQYENDFSFESEDEEDEEEKEEKKEEEKTKTCTKCEKTKNINAFFDRIENKDGKENLCKLCIAKRSLIAKKKREIPVDPNPITKTCRKCKEDLSIEMFNDHSTSKDGHQFTCKLCKNPPVTNRTEKKCSACQEMKPMSEYTNCRTSVDGKFAYCKPCSKLKSSKYREKGKQKTVTVTVDTKQCSDCNEVKNATEFWKHPSTKDRLAYNCKQCYYKRRKEKNKKD